MEKIPSETLWDALGRGVCYVIKFISRAEMYISRLEMYISAAEMYISAREMNFFSCLKLLLLRRELFSQRE